MISILETLQILSPNFNSNTSCREKDDRVNIQGILLGGDQLSTAMARLVIADRKNSMNAEQSLNGVIPVV